MTTRSAIGAVLGVVAVATTGCATIQGRPTAAESVTRSPATTSSLSEAPVATPSAAPSGPPIGTATMQVRGGTGSATIRYQINGGPQLIETDATLPWEKQYPVYNEIESSVTADAGDTELICTIIMDGNLLAFETESRPTCSFAYFG